MMEENEKINNKILEVCVVLFVACIIIGLILKILFF